MCTGDQWFVSEVFRPQPEAVFVDGGAYDGDTALEFVARNGGPGRSLELFEPDRGHCECAASRLASHGTAALHCAGLGSRHATASFASTGGMDGAFRDDGAGDSEVVALDDVLDTPPTYVKLDVEGYEEAALTGAEQTIREATPVLAVAAYHRAEDLWRIPAWIDRLDAGYRLYLRHHTELAFETVVYAAV